jgi:hypothetical protein
MNYTMNRPYNQSFTRLGFAGFYTSDTGKTIVAAGTIIQGAAQC